MRLFLLTTLTMIAFAANSVLNRAALASGGIGAIEFANIRLIAGAAMLAILALALRRQFVFGGPGRIAAVAGLLLYLFGFSLAYVSLDSGLGALILFGTVQITMFSGSVLGGERPPAQRWLGAGLAFGGLAWLLWPTGQMDLSLIHAVAMIAAGIGWGVYSLAGRKANDPLLATAANFVIAVPLGLIMTTALPVQMDPVAWTNTGIGLAVISGAITSGLGYALWYTVLPRLAGTVAAVAQLTVPIIAMLGGMLFLNEALTLDFVIAAALVLGGVTLSVVRWNKG